MLRKANWYGKQGRVSLTLNGVADLALMMVMMLNDFFKERNERTSSLKME
jgi:hypothetical protein